MARFPKRKRTKKPTKVRHLKRKMNKRFNKIKSNMISYTGPGMAPLPDMYFTKLRYSDWWNVASTGTTGVNDIVYRGNNCYDPQFDTGGIGCNGFIELAAIYQQYRVFACKIEVAVKSISNNTDIGDFMFLVNPDRASTDYSMSDVINRQHSPYAIMKQVHRTADKSIIFKQFRRTKDIYGESEIDDDNYTQSTAGSPALVNAWYWHLVAARGDQSAINPYPGYQMHVKLTYYVRFERRKALQAPTTV